MYTETNQLNAFHRGAFLLCRKKGADVMNEHEVSSVLTDIRERVVRVETKIDNMTDVRATADEAKNTSTEALTSSRSAHKRLDKIDKMIFWLGTTVIGSVILATLNLITRG